jgi:membrane-associated phospholipid phosphatase
MQTSRLQSRNWNWFCALLIALLLSGLAILVRHGNYRSFELLNPLHTQALDTLFRYVTLMGHGLFNIVVSLFLFLVLRKTRLSALVLVTFITSGLCAQAIKKLVGAPRPSVALAHSGYSHFIPGLSHGGYESFPSGHTTTIFALCMLLALCTHDARKQLGLFLVALLTGYSRIYLGSHFLPDVLAGAVLGSGISVLAYRLSSLKARWMRLVMPNKGTVTIP